MKQMMAILFAGILLFLSSGSVLAQSGNTATVIFYRASDDGGKAYALTSQNQELARLNKGGKFEQQLLAPGTYYYMADPTTKQVFTLDVKAGQTYYVKASKSGNFFKGQPTLQITSSQEYQQALANAD